MEKRVRTILPDQTFKKLLWILLIAAAIYILIYTATACTFFPFETWFDQMRVITKAEEGRLDFSDLFTVYGEHGMLGENILFLLNCKLFNLSNEASAIATSIVPILLLLIISISILRRKETFRNPIGIALLGLIWIILIPINTYSTGMNIQVRMSLVFFVLTAVQIDQVFRSEKIHPARVVLLFLTMFVGINIFGTLYSMAGIPCVFLYMLIGSIRKKEHRGLKIAIMAAYCIFAVLYFYEYGFIGRERPPMELGGNEGALNNLLSQLSDLKNVAKAFLAWCVNGFVFHYTYNEGVIPERTVFLLGGILLAFYIYGIVIYIKNKQYKTFYLPAFLISYAVIVWIMLLAGRPSDWTWYLGNWYSIHSRMLPLGVLLIFGYEYATRGEGQKSNWILLRTLCYILVIIVISSITVAHLWRRAPHAKNWENSRFKYLFVENEHDLPKDENDWTPLSNSWTVTLEGIQTMRKNNLNVYRITNEYKEMNGLYMIGSSLGGCHIIDGHYDDGWLAEKASLQIKTKEQGVIHIEFRNPLEAYIGAEGIISINDKSYPIQIGEEEFSADFTTDADSVVTVQFDFSSFATRPSEQDQRILSVILKDIYAE